LAAAGAAIDLPVTGSRMALATKHLGQPGHRFAPFSRVPAANQMWNVISPTRGATAKTVWEQIAELEEQQRQATGR